MDLGDQAKNILKSFVKEIDPKISQYFDQELKSGFGFNSRQKQLVQDMLLHSQEYILRPTKRLRGSFVNFGYLLGGKKPNKNVWQAAIGTELVHAAILMHDDFMDLDDRRRKGPTTHRYFEDKFKGSEHFGHSMAMNMGDVLLCLGFELIEKAGSSQAMIQMLRGVANTAFGQAYDVSLETYSDWTEDDVLTLHAAKTAIYSYENPLFIGAHLAKLSPSVFEILHEYSMDGGVAFQLQDDILGVYGDSDKTGKSSDSDLKQGKCTLMVLKSLDQPEVKKVWGNIQATREDLDAAKKAIMNCGAYDYNKRLAQDYAHKAAKTAEKLRGLSLNSEAIDYIQGIAEYMVKREV